MGSREFIAYALTAAFVIVAIVFILRVRSGFRRADRQDRKHVQIDLMRRSEPQLDEEGDGSR